MSSVKLVQLRASMADILQDLAFLEEPDRFRGSIAHVQSLALVWTLRDEVQCEIEKLTGIHG